MLYAYSMESVLETRTHEFLRIGLIIGRLDTKARKNPVNNRSTIVLNFSNVFQDINGVGTMSKDDDERSDVTFTP